MASKRMFFLLLIVLCFCSISAAASAGVVNLPQTGLTTCVTSTGLATPCAGTGQDAEYRAGVLWPVPRFTDNGDGTMTDNLTGLMWTKDTGTPTVGSCSGGAQPWANGLSYVDCLNNSTYLGHNDWRMPNINELESLMVIDTTKTTDWLTQQGFLNVTTWYFSSTTYAAYTSSAWSADFYGSTMAPTGKNASYRIWPVRQ